MCSGPRSGPIKKGTYPVVSHPPIPPQKCGPIPTSFRSLGMTAPTLGSPPLVPQGVTGARTHHSLVGSLGSDLRGGLGG